VPVATIYDWRVDGKGPRAFRVGKHLKFSARDINVWLAQLREPAPGQSPRDRLRAQRIGPVAPTVEGGRASTSDVASSSSTAVVAYNDLVAIGIMQGLGGAVPHKVSVIGCDNIMGSDWCSPKRTTLAAPLHNLGATAMRNLLAIVGGADGRTARPYVLPTQLIVRESTGPAHP
jgi:LacI family transcriptional regulator